MNVVPFNDLPQEIQDVYKTIKGCNGQFLNRVHKAVKKGHSTIVVHTTDHKKDVWKKQGKGWVLDNDSPEKLPDVHS